MQTLIKNASRNRQYPSPGIRTKGYPDRSKAGKVENSRVRKPNNGFLTSVFKPLHVGLFYPEYSEENYRFMYETVMNYARLLKKELQVKYDPFNWKTLFEKFGDILPENNEYKLVVDSEEGSVKMELWLYDDRYNDHHLYYLPCEIINRTEGLFQEILIAFFRLLRHKQRFNIITDSCFFEMMEEQIEEETGEEQKSDWAIELNQYINGYKKDLFDIISQKPKHSIETLKRIVSDFQPKCRRESNLRLLILEGLELFKKRKKILWYGTFPEAESDSYTIMIDEVIQITYEEDSFQEEYIRYLNETAQESGFEFISTGKIELTPATRRLLKPDKYVIDFMDWLNKLDDELYYL